MRSRRSYLAKRMMNMTMITRMRKVGTRMIRSIKMNLRRKLRIYLHLEGARI